MTFSLLLQKAKPESGITGKGEGEGAGDATPGGSETAALGSLCTFWAAQGVAVAALGFG